MSGPQFDPLTTLMPGVKEPRLAPPAARLEDAPLQAATSAGRAQLDARLAAVLRGAAEALGFQAAELWLLDDATVRLRRRVAWDADFDPTGVGADDRPLALAEADLAALAGGAVVVESASDARGLSLHREAGSAVGVPAASDLTIHGVLWVFGTEREIGDGEVELLEIVAARLAVELERDALLAERPKIAEPIAEPEATSLLTELPSQPLLHDALDAAGWVDPHAGVAFHDRAELSDGRVLSLAGFVLDSPGVGSESSLVAAQTARVAARTLAAGCDNAGDLLARVNETLWQTTASGEGVALAAAIIDPEGLGSYAAAGPTVALRIRPDGAASASCEETPLGWDLDAEYAATDFELVAGERVILAVGDPRLTSPSDERALADVFRAATGDARVGMTSEACLKRLRTARSDAVAAAAAVSIRRR